MLKQFLKRRAPKLFEAVKSLSIVKSFQRKRAFRLLNGGSDFRAKKSLVALYGQKVITGPFQGMMYGDNSTGSSYVAKLVGSYEEELHPTIEAIVASKPDVVIDVGCAEGYYAVGLAKRLPSTQVFAYDIEPDAREFCAELAKINGLQERVQVRGLFNVDVLEEMTAKPAFIFCDCEGFEAELFNEASVPLLRKCDFLIEFHDFMIPEISHVLCKRFAETHDVQIIDTRVRDVAQYTCLADVPLLDREAALSENRPGPMQWGYFRSLNHK